MSDLMFAVDKLRWSTDQVTVAAKEQSARLNKIITATVRAHQECRLAKNYAVSDLLRAILHEAGIEIIQGSAGYAYEDIPPALKGRPVHDTWKFK